MLSDVLLFYFIRRQPNHESPTGLESNLAFMSIFLCQLSLKRSNQGIFFRKHINNVFRSSEVDKNNNTQKMRVAGVKQPVAFYSLDVILAVGYRVNSKRGIDFRKWANNVLKQFILKGYAINEKRLQALKKTVDIQSRMLADALDIEEKDVMVKLVMNLLKL